MSPGSRPPEGMLHYDELATPGEDGGILVAPSAAGCVRALRHNHEQLARANGTILDRPLSYWRERTRDRLDVRDGDLLIATGHQPAFLHAGVWAKNIVASRLAGAVGGRAVNLVVDNDAPDHTMLDVPEVVDGRVRLRRIPFARIAAGRAYEQIPAQTAKEIDAFESQVRSAMAAAYERSAMPEYLKGFGVVDRARDWVTQAVAGRRAVDALHGVALEDHRVSRLWWTPLLCEIIREAPRFAAAYNRALAEYRREHHVRGVGQPVPDLLNETDLAEIPIWGYRRGEARQRVGVRRRGDRFTLIGQGEPILEYDRGELSGEAESLDAGPWMLRPRALTLTLWARLFAADLFIHGIGGAKYDRITDAIIRDYFQTEPPRIACVSATLRLTAAAPLGLIQSRERRLAQGDPPRIGESDDPTPERLRHQLRDVQWNPQRYVGDGRDVSSLIEDRASAVEESATLRTRSPADRRGRRDVFHRIRELSQQILDARPDLLEQKSRELSVAKERAEERRLANGREYFFALHDRRDLARLVDALPGEGGFRL